MKVKLFRLLMLAGAVFLLVGTPEDSFAQMDQGRIVGQIVDTKSASVPHAKVIVRNERIGESRTVETNDEGNYQLLALKPSFYTISINADGFAPAEMTSVQLSVGQEIHRNFTLQLASVNESVEVVVNLEGAIDTSSASMGANVNQREITELPLNGRQVSQLFLQAPGSQNNGTGTFGEIRLSGRSWEENAIRYDGIEGSNVISGAPGVLNDELNTPFRLQASLENIQEFRIESNSYPAEYGTGSGGQITLITKSGSNAFHGSAFEYFRNDKLDARNFFDPVQKSELRLNQFGGSLGGPIVKDKLFFFGYYEGYRLRAGINSIEAVPKAATQAVNGQTPSEVDPRILPLLPAFIGKGAVIMPGATKDPNSPFDIYRLNGLSTVDENSGGLRVDYRINQRHTLYARMFRDQGNWISPEGVTGRELFVTLNPQNAVLSLQSNLRSTLVNEAKVGFNEALSRINGVAPVIPGVDLSAIAVSISGNVANSGIVGQGSDTGVATPGGLVRSNSASNGQAQPYTPYSLSFIDSLSWLAGKHSLKFGVEVRALRLYTDRIGGSTYTFLNLNNFLKNTLASTAYLSPVSSPTPYNTGATGNRLLKEEYYIGYAQDEFRIRPHLTLNYGLRYEYFAPMREDRNLYIGFDTNTGVMSSPNFCYSPVLPQTAPGLCPGGARDWYKSSAGNFGPRVAIAWSPFSSQQGTFGGDHTVLRAGFGILFGPPQAETLLQPVESDRVWMSRSGGSYCGTTDPTCPTTPQNLTAFFTNPANINNRQAQVRAYAPDFTVPERIYQYTASWQQQWGSKLVSTVAYVGSQGRNLFLRNITNRIVSVRNNTVNGSAIVVRQFDIDKGGNTVLRPYTEIDYKTSGGHDSYNSLQAQLVRRSSSGLTLSAQYTLSKSFGNSAGYKEALTVGNPFDFEYDNGYNLFDVRHSANVSALYDLPFGKGKHYLSDANGLAQAVLGNWELGTIVSVRSGLPIDMRIVRPDVVYLNRATGIISTSQISGCTPGVNCLTAIINTPGGGASRNVRRPDLIAGVDPFLPNGWLNPAAFTVPQPGTYGNLQRGALHGPGYVQTDLTVAKRFPVRESLNLEFRAEVYNLFNHTNFQNPIATLGAGLGATTQPGMPFTVETAGAGGRFGQFNQTVSRTVGTGTNRQIQFALRLNF
ncbi:MAG TPA: carboxypeptidase regulatory-like domain-containing protein [Candidatus Dormibacteraeota bacterium]|nr:carboxypeptidase regulatory-like domain-containing protein [Candidatus Dormibacteraeota bacterium]